MSDWTQGPYHMTCGSYEAERNIYRKLTGKSGLTWLVKVGRQAAEHVYVEGGPRSRGYGGRTLKFELEDGSLLSLTGPWHTTADELFKDTGHDVRGTYATFVVIGRDRDATDSGRTIIRDVVYKDEAPTEGLFSRGEHLAQKLANKLGVKLYFCMESSGGGMTSWADPEKERAEPS